MARQCRRNDSIKRRRPSHTVVSHEQKLHSPVEWRILSGDLSAISLFPYTNTKFKQKKIAYKADAMHARVASVRFIFVQYCNDQRQWHTAKSPKMYLLRRWFTWNSFHFALYLIPSCSRSLGRSVSRKCQSTVVHICFLLSIRLSAPAPQN